ncbi:hypothetical protein NZK35_26800, partial [Stieleria sp. ICT_E10.1]|uniref:hypothetical protein n=1 Tax=Stieleria sedimenti TaxID=2976331 RepID=UPI00217F56BE
VLGFSRLVSLLRSEWERLKTNTTKLRQTEVPGRLREPADINRLSAVWREPTGPDLGKTTLSLAVLV